MARRSTSTTRALLPNLAGWDTYPRAFVSALLVGLVALCGEWIVHQLQYRIEYGSRFDAVMATSPHRLYMTPLGLWLLAISLTAIALTCALLSANTARSRQIIGILPARAHRFLPDGTVSLPCLPVLATVAVLATYQTVIYFVQENLESAVAGQGWPGLLVVFSPQHETLLPLQVLVALCGSLLLWTACTLLHRSRHVLDTVRTLARLFLRPQAPQIDRPAFRSRIPSLRLTGGVLGLRSPPQRI